MTTPTKEELQKLIDNGDNFNHSGFYATYSGSLGRYAVEVCSLYGNVSNCIVLTTGQQRELPTDEIYYRGHEMSMLALEIQIPAYEAYLKTHTPSKQGWKVKGFGKGD